ncbi:MAG: alkyl hydroperoxide reductase subunit F [Burkholderiaceae bacterium]|jgi:alkyl hydroperoxide reductase subunit F|nr:alkyl hydroperoxide reductase subunit F [Burkholderiaceae bacterium]
MLDDTIRQQLAAYLERVTQPFEIVAALGGDAKSAELHELLSEIAAMRPGMIALRTNGQDRRVPSFTLERIGAPARLRFAAIPLGHEFTSLVLALLWTGGHPPKEAPELLEQIKALEANLNFEVYMSLSCHNCPDVVQALALMATLNPRITVTVIDGGLFQQEIDAREIMGVPTVYLNGQPFANGHMGLEDILHKVDSGAAQRDAVRISAKAPFEVLVIGGGPAGAAAAIYAARKGIRTGLVADRLGGQVNDTNEIENYPGLPQTNGPAYAAALAGQVRGYGVDVMNAQRVTALTPAARPGGLANVTLDNGGQLHSRAVIVATGARWRNVGCPGEQEYKTRGVAYCPHCDGPLFKGKDVAVIGGGNSGVEAAIDLAGVVQHVTLLEFLPEMKADAVLIDKLRSLPNVTVHTNAQTTGITGADGKVNGLHFKRRDSGELVQLPLEGVFVQIGLIPDTEWLGGAVERTRQGEIVIDAKGQTSAPGIFAAGDCTTTPYKQIVVAAGSGAAAALSAFDYLIRTPAMDAGAKNG